MHWPWAESPPTGTSCACAKGRKTRHACHSRVGALAGGLVVSFLLLLMAWAPQTFSLFDPLPNRWQEPVSARPLCPGPERISERDGESQTDPRAILGSVREAHFEQDPEAVVPGVESVSLACWRGLLGPEDEPRDLVKALNVSCGSPYTQTHTHADIDTDTLSLTLSLSYSHTHTSVSRNQIRLE